MNAQSCTSLSHGGDAVKSASPLTRTILVVVLLLTGAYTIAVTVGADEAPSQSSLAPAADSHKPTIVDPFGAAQHVTNQKDLELTVELQSDKVREGTELQKNSSWVALVDGARVTDKQPLTDDQIRTAASAKVTFRMPLSLAEGTHLVVCRWYPDPNEDAHFDSEPFEITVDTTPPRFTGTRMMEVPGDGSRLVVRFAEDDLDSDTVKELSFRIRSKGTDGRFSETPDHEDPVSDGREVWIKFASLPTGTYQLTVVGEGNDALKDKAGNAFQNGQDRIVLFSSFPERERGEHVPFPLFTPPTPAPTPEEGFNPADYVQTRVARLYYFRDAHRVAEILNRNVRSYNRAAVTQAERRAEEARDDADSKTDERRAKEREAIRSAQAARNAEGKLASARQALPEVTELQNQYIQKKNESDSIAAVVDGVDPSTSFLVKTQKLEDSRQARIEAADNLQKANTELKAAELNAIQHPNVASAQERLRTAQTDHRAKSRALEDAVAAEEKLERLVSLDGEMQQIGSQLAPYGKTPENAAEGLRDSIADMEQAVANLRREEIRTQETAAEADAAESRAKEKQFREEVAAATTDPDTYVPADIKSVDPVTQVSISVIGEGVIHLRGPIKGINKIRTMINQIDSPLGQVKIGIHTVQVNGEKGDRMEGVVGRIESNIDLGRFLVNQSLNLIRRAVQMEAARVAAEQAEMHPGHYQVDRDRRYLYAFFGRDFIDELYAMDSEFLRSENSILSLHSMDTVSLNRALFIMALAKNDVRENMLRMFMELVRTDLPQAEYDFRRASELRPHRTDKFLPPWNRYHLPLSNKYPREKLTCEAVFRNANQRYHFRNLTAFFHYGVNHPDTMNPMQREFVRLAQIFKARMIAEMEWRQRVLERGLIEDPANDEKRRRELLEPVHENALRLVADAHQGSVTALAKIQESADVLDATLVQITEVQAAIVKLDTLSSQYEVMRAELRKELRGFPTGEHDDEDAVTAAAARLARAMDPLVRPMIDEGLRVVEASKGWDWMSPKSKETILEKAVVLSELSKALNVLRKVSFDVEIEAFEIRRAAHTVDDRITDLADAVTKILQEIQAQAEPWKPIPEKLSAFIKVIEGPGCDSERIRDVDQVYEALMVELEKVQVTVIGIRIITIVQASYRAWQRSLSAEQRIRLAEQIAKQTRLQLNHRKLLNHLIDEQEDKYIELVEGTRAHIAVLDNYLKRLAIALEDDFKTQFYDPAFIRIRGAAREYDVTLGQVERTTILTNNRAFAKVTPEATMEFDLPKRKIAIVEAMEGAKAMAEDYGALLDDPTFLAAYEMMGGGKQPANVNNVLPGLPTSTDQHRMGLVPEQPARAESALQQLVPDPAIYKFETGTGFEIRPVIQPDGDSVIYDFDYMYTTNVREPVRADEKHLGRIKRHFVHTQVQTSSFELREISRYLVALKAARTARGVPLLEDIPILGVAFRPAASAESSIQQNIILGQTTVYPTVFDLMGLRWAPHVVDVDHRSLLDSEYIVRGRNQSIDNFVFDEASKRVDEFFDLKEKHPDHYRPDLYHRRGVPTPHHPGGYTYRPHELDTAGKARYGPPLVDPNGARFEQPDPRPPEMQDPPFELHRHRPIVPETIQGSTPSLSPRAVHSPTSSGLQLPSTPPRSRNTGGHIPNGGLSFEVPSPLPH